MPVLIGEKKAQMAQRQTRSTRTTVPEKTGGGRTPNTDGRPRQTATRDWKRELMTLLQLHGRVSAHARDGKLKPISHRTLAAREAILFMCMHQLHEMGYALQSVHGIGGRHVDALVRRWEEEGAAAGTIQNRLAVLRTLSLWIGKAGMVKKTEHYEDEPGRLKRQVVASRDKSWTAAGVSPEQIIKEASILDRYVGMQLKVIHAFGLRREEAIQFKPYKVDEGSALRVRDGTKGGRERMVPVENDYQRQILAEAKAFVSRWDGSIGRPGKDLKQNIDRFAYIMKKLGLTKEGLGVTAHGLRHQRLNDIFEEVAGVPSPVRQASGLDRINKGDDPERWKEAQQKVSSVAGHARLSISSAYTGSPQSVSKPRLDWTAGAGGVMKVGVQPGQVSLEGLKSEGNAR